MKSLVECGCENGDQVENAGREGGQMEMIDYVIRPTLSTWHWCDGVAVCTLRTTPIIIRSSRMNKSAIDKNRRIDK